MKSEHDKKTHFGFQNVAWGEKAASVAKVFHSVASKYDIMNDFMSFGLHRLWKQKTLSESGVQPGNNVLDLAGGTGDLAKVFAKRVGREGRVVLCDINESMLISGRERLVNANVVANVDYVQADAEALPFPDNYFDCITIAFGLRNVTDKAAALRSMHRVLKPDGQLLILEFSKVPDGMMKKIYDWYSFNVIPRIGKVVANDHDSYQYLVESIRMHPDQETLLGMMREAGFQSPSYTNLTNGVVALHRGFK
ncbi:MAG: bifunctional demethylmenaquinone methyltransferase/2-methoxy-6-polyprenyl-1,4-benzoquinol methylase UbiE [Legionellaceae bacterium]|nr:bifunctional demethylmenaquinone methyltransferase/2-methoxy-6-polyprenyl-1,4-benzoquinol methylase UbiE [Legionellaceae bacterium]